MTPAGRATLAAGVLGVLTGLMLGYPSVTALGATLVIAVIIAAVSVRRSMGLRAERVLEPERVTEGDEASSHLTVTNESRRTMPSGVVQERVGDAEVDVDLPQIEPGEQITVVRTLPTNRRGVFRVGPLTVRRGDPIGLARRGEDQRDLATLTVHPRIHLVSPFPAGVLRDLDGLPSGEAMEGGVTFSGLRPYVPGDDLRLVHWRSSARMGELMVRHNIDLNRPRTSIILDTNARVYDEESFEDAVRVAASIVAAAILRSYPFELRTTSGHVIDHRSSRLRVFDLLAEIEPVDRVEKPLAVVADETSRGPRGLSCAAVSGRATLDDLRSLGPVRSRFEQLTIVRLGTGRQEEIHRLVGADLINANHSEDFARAWNRWSKS